MIIGLKNELNKPAIVWYDRLGKIDRGLYYVNGKQIKK